MVADMSESKKEVTVGPFHKRERLSDSLRRKLAERACRTAVDDLSAWKAVYELSIELRNFEINQLVQRNNFFMIFQGVLFAGVCQSSGQIPVVSFMVCLVGCSVALLQAGMAAGAKYWQEHWELNSRMSEDAMLKLLQKHRVYRYLNERLNIEIEPALDQKLLQRQSLIKLFEDDSNAERIKESVVSGRPHARLANWMILKRFSASRIPIYVGLVLAIGWFVLLLFTFRFDFLNLHVWDGMVGFPQRK